MSMIRLYILLKSLFIAIDILGRKTILSNHLKHIHFITLVSGFSVSHSVGSKHIHIALKFQYSTSCRYKVLSKILLPLMRIDHNIYNIYCI